ncbi:MAG: biosynthetic-type acetolactate synthase large subunit [Spirochaetaceae bacterium]|jgi:acetolactate synthase-1/2/3 large subunit|nr:biosynthetic-type acetolactate synthase large subunit [Spirochaetaceae bacterium]
MHYTGARILIEALIAEGVDTVFGYPGGSVLNLYDELYQHRDRIRHILVSHEQHAAHAADGYARSTGKVGVCIATSGPGATNLVTGIATAYMDSSPLVAITGNVALHLLGKDSFQEVDIAGVTMPVVKHNWIVKDLEDLAEVVREAFIVARSGRPGPVLIDIPKDITGPRVSDEAACPPLAPKEALPGPRARRLAERFGAPTFTEEDIDRAVAVLCAAKRPVLYAGGGVNIAGASTELALLAERINAPVSLSLMGIGAFPREHRLCMGLIGMHGTVASNKAVQKADLLVAVGARFSDRVVSRADQFAAAAKVLHLDIDPAEINKNIAAAVSVVGDIKEIIGKILQKLPERTETEWNGEIEKWKARTPAAHHRKTSLHPRFIIEETARALGHDALVATDVGQHQIWTAQFYPFSKPRSFLSSGGLGTMGFGLGAALGAKIANPKRPVALFTGDGSFRMNCSEMGTLAAYGIPLLILIFNNRTLGMVRQWQTLFYEEHYAETTLERPPDFVKLAEAYGFSGYRAADEPAFTEALNRALADIAAGNTALIDAQIDQDEKVLPMVPGGQAIDEQIL